MAKLKIVYRKIDELIPYENNPRINDKAVDAVAASIKEFGFNVPIVIDADSVIVAGHTRLEAAKILQLSEVPTVSVDSLTDEQIRAYRLADNKTAELAQWDWSKLEEELANIDTDMSVYGFDDVRADDYDDAFTLSAEEKSEYVTMSLTLHVRQADYIKSCIDLIDDCSETYGNTNSNGNAVFEIVKQWAESRI